MGDGGSNVPASERENRMAARLRELHETLYRIADPGASPADPETLRRIAREATESERAVAEELGPLATELGLGRAGVDLSLSGDWQDLVASPRENMAPELSRAFEANYEPLLRNELFHSSLAFFTRQVEQNAGPPDGPAARAALGALTEDQEPVLTAWEEASLEEYKDALRAWLQRGLAVLHRELARHAKHREAAPARDGTAAGGARRQKTGTQAATGGGHAEPQEAQTRMPMAG